MKLKFTFYLLINNFINFNVILKLMMLINVRLKLIFIFNTKFTYELNTIW